MHCERIPTDVSMQWMWTDSKFVAPIEAMYERPFWAYGPETSTHLDALREESIVARSRFFDVRVDRRDDVAAIGQDAHHHLDVGVLLLADLVDRLLPATVHEKSTSQLLDTY